MRLLEQQAKIIVQNVDFMQRKTPRHSTLLPDSIRALIVGPSNCGKTNVMLSLIESPNGLKFENVYIYSKSLYQTKYEYLKKLISTIKGMRLYTFNNNDDVIQTDEIKPNSIMIFDDVACDKQNNIKNYFSMGRHKNVDSFYLCQTYTRIPKHLLRDNANLIIVFKQDDLNLRHIFNDHVGCDISFEDFKKICHECWKEKYGFLTISKDDEIHSGRYRKGFHIFIQP